MDAPRRFPFTLSDKLRRRSVVMLALLACASAAMARDDADNPFRPDDLTPAEIAEPDNEGKAWREEQFPLPAFPRAEDLLPIRTDAGGPGYNYFMDVNSVSFGPDGVLRYTIIIQSPQGASNVVYEGIRCATDEIKTIAYGTRNGDFRRLPDAEWTYVRSPGPLAYRTALAELYICDEHGLALDSDSVLERLVLHDPRRSRVAPKVAPASD